MEIPVHIDALRDEGERMTAAIDRADPGGGVPSCPGWTVRDLVRHLGGVHRWATGYITIGRTEISHAELDEVVASWPADADLAAWLAQGCADLVAALVAAPDDLQCWTFLPAPSPRAMWARRQAHETAIHRVDAEQAVGAAVTGFAAPFAADGIDELLRLFVPRRTTGLHADPPTSLALRCTDVGPDPDPDRDADTHIDASWLLHLDADGVRTTSGDVAGAACTVAGAAGDLFLALWNRSGADALTIEGDRRVLGQFAEAVQIRWS
jgi:uncharacterized protein (TIGR03083 family)